METNFAEAQRRKTSKYHEITEEIEANGFIVDLITIEVGSRGFVCLDGFNLLKDIFFLTRNQIQQLLKDVSAAAIKGSFKIWTHRNHHPD